MFRCHFIISLNRDATCIVMCTCHRAIVVVSETKIGRHFSVIDRFYWKNCTIITTYKYSGA